ncbi:MAG: endonuclease/exonuclease/phosphatase family protein [Alcaligenaceae bacterium]|nr:endonuclease/exonuclease/phosphatase family protein [Alcaligenaceae bacterium]
MAQLKVLTYNIHKGKAPLGIRPSFAHLKGALQRENADLIFLQEVQGRNDLEDALHNQPERLAEALGMHVVYGRNAIRRKTDHGNALLSRYPIICQDNQDISDHRLEQRGVLHVQVQVEERIVHCFVVHLGLFKQSRKRQTEAIASRINSMVQEDEPIIIAGDFNDWTEHLSSDLMSILHLQEVFEDEAKRIDMEFPAVKLNFQKGLSEMTEIWQNPELKNRLERLASYMKTDSFKRLTEAFFIERRYYNPRTFPASFPWLRLDRMYQRGFEIHTTEVLKGKPWTKISDHLPLSAKLRLLK